MRHGIRLSTVKAWLQRADLNGSLVNFFNPPLTPEERGVANIEGWILGVVQFEIHRAGLAVEMSVELGV